MAKNDKLTINMSDDIPRIGERVEFASRFVKKSKNLLDVGCGNGVIHHFVKDRVEDIYGIDFSRSDLLKAKKRGLITHHVDIDKNKLPFKNKIFDIVTCLDVIEHVKDPELVLTEIRRVLKDGGNLIVSTPNIRFTDHLGKLIFKGKFPKTSMEDGFLDGGHIHFFTFKDLKNLLVHVGFRVISEEGIINKKSRGWKGRILEMIFGKKIMREFRSGGILIVAEK